jgi:hypothetical protein
MFRYPTKELTEKYLMAIVTNDLDGIFGME